MYLNNILGVFLWWITSFSLTSPSFPNCKAICLGFLPFETRCNTFQLYFRQNICWGFRSSKVSSEYVYNIIVYNLISNNMFFVNHPYGYFAFCVLKKQKKPTKTDLFIYFLFTATQTWCTRCTVMCYAWVTCVLLCGLLFEHFKWQVDAFSQTIYHDVWLECQFLSYLSAFSDFWSLVVDVSLVFMVLSTCW